MDTAKKNKNTSLYWLGLAEFIPLVGAFIGIALILYGIFKYKDKILVAIGSLGVLFTVGAYYFLFYDLKYGKKSGEDFSKIAQKELVGVVSQIELYKLQNSVYPDSLQQLLINDPMLPIEDPLLIRKMEKGKKITFNYKKMGEKYTVFSAGIDAIPYTADDIYPPDSLNNRGGLIKVN